MQPTRWLSTLRVALHSAVIVSAVACGGNGSTPAPDAGDGNNDGNDSGNTGRDSGSEEDSGAVTTDPDSGAGEGGVDAGDGGGVKSTFSGTSWVQPTSGSGMGMSQNFAAQITIGAPLPVGEGESANYKLRLGLPPR